jgi:hypothetical protein
MFGRQMPTPGEQATSRAVSVFGRWRVIFAAKVSDSLGRTNQGKKSLLTNSADCIERGGCVSGPVLNRL